MAVDCAKRLELRHPTDPRTMSALFRLQGHWSKLSADDKKTHLQTEESIKEVDSQIAGFLKTAQKVEADLKSKTQKTVEDWLELARLQRISGAPALDKQAVEASLKDAKRVRHDTLVQLDKRMGEQSIKAVCKELFPKSTYF